MPANGSRSRSDLPAMTNCVARSGNRNAWLALLIVTSACGGNSHSRIGENPGTAGGGSAGASASNAGAFASSGAPAAAGSSDAGKTPCYGGCTTEVQRPKASAPPQCPAGEPSAGTACTHESLRCSYGDSRTAQCRHIDECTNGFWQADTSILDRYSCDPLPADYCPSEPHHQQPCTIGIVGMPCEYGELSCVCYARDPAPGKHGNWLCYGPPANPECPAIAPNLGAGCGSKGLACNYDGDACLAAPNSSLFCFDGAWEQGEGYNCAI
jgi:hypothetical protein